MNIIYYYDLAGGSQQGYTITHDTLRKIIWKIIVIIHTHDSKKSKTGKFLP